MKYIKNILIILLALYSTFFWLSALAVPFLSIVGNYDFSANLNYLFSYSCHQNPERSFWIMGYPVSLCARCLGVYLGTTLSCCLALFNKLNISLKNFIIMALFCSADIILNLFKINTGNITRFFTGLIMGLLITITVNFILKRSEKKYEN